MVKIAALLASQIFYCFTLHRGPSQPAQSACFEEGYSSIPANMCKNRVARRNVTALEFCTKSRYLLLSISNRMQRYTVFFITVSAVHILGGFSADHEELKSCTHSIWYMSGLMVLPLAVAASKLGIDKYQMLCVQFLSS
jgi:hypothetical protein